MTSLKKGRNRNDVERPGSEFLEGPNQQLLWKQPAQTLPRMAHRRRNPELPRFSATRKTNNLVEVVFKFDLVNDSNQVIATYDSKYSVYGSGDVLVDNHFKMSKKDLPGIVRMGMNL